MDRTMRFNEDLSVQYRVGGYLLGDSLDTPGNGRGAKSKVRILHLVTTPTEGCELLKRLRSDPLTNDTPIMILTR